MIVLLSLRKASCDCIQKLYTTVPPRVSNYRTTLRFSVFPGMDAITEGLRLLTNQWNGVAAIVLFILRQAFRATI